MSSLLHCQDKNRTGFLKGLCPGSYEVNGDEGL